MALFPLKKPADNSFWGVALNTVKGIPKAAEGLASGLAKGNVGAAFGNEQLNRTPAGTVANIVLGTPQAFWGVAKDVAKGAAEFGLSTGEALPRLAAPDLNNKVVPPKTVPGLGFLGPVQSFQSQAAQAVEDGQSPAKAITGGFWNTAVNEPVGVSLKPIAVAGGLLGKVLTPAVEKSLQIIADTKEIPAITKQLSKLGLSEETATQLAPKLVDIAEPKAVNDVINETTREVAPKTLSAVDKAIAENKVRVVSRNGMETYQYKKGDKWVTAPTDADAVSRLKNYEVGKPVLEGQKTLPLEPTALAAKKTGVPPLARSEGEVRSIEAEAEKSLAKLDPTIQKEVSSLSKIVEQEPTPVNKKINLLDYVRTPDRVLRKIGFEPESKALRGAYDAYTKELPKNIDKISEWVKRVPEKGASERIFKYLDGQPITLSPKEREVAIEVKSWLKDWADRLGLPEDNRIANYITHLFDDQLIKKEFDEDLAKIIADKIPGEVYNPFLQKRLGAKGYRQDAWAALDAYVKRATRKAHLDPVLERIQGKTGSSLEYSNIEESQWKYLQHYVKNVQMRPTNLDNLVDNTVKSLVGYKFGQRPVTYLTRLLRRMTYRGMLGLNPGSAFRNLSQGINTYATLGEKYTAIGYANLFKRNAVKELREEGVLANNFIEDRTLSATKKNLQRIDKGLFVLFDTAEKINRGAAYFGAKAKALKEGKTAEEAVDYAKEIVRKTQFQYDKIDAPVAMASDIAKTLLQFQTFTVKQGEFLAEMAKDRNVAGLMRYGLAGLAFVYTIGQAFGMKPEELIPSFRFGVPPSLKFPVETTKALLNTPDKYGKERDLKKKLSDVAKAGIGLIPAGNQIKKTYEGIKAINEGGSFDKAGKLQFQVGPTLPQKAQAVLFGKYSGQGAQDYFDALAGVPTAQQKQLQKVYEDVQSLAASGNTTEAQALVDGLSDADYEVYKKIKSAETAKKTLQGKKDILPVYQQVQSLVKEGKPDEAQAIVDSLTDDEYKYYKLVKKQVEKDQKAAEGEKPTYTDGEPQTAAGLVNTVATYAHAIGVDPVTAFNRIFTGQKIRYVANGTVVVERLPLEKSQQIKQSREGDSPDFKLDHIVPLQLGGSNTESNLALVPTDQWESYTPVENALGKALRAGTIDKKTAQKLIRDLKNGVLTAKQVYQQLP